jgi:ubiquinone/menaquinone biosynthesis C-methylase UbiE
MNYYSDDKDFVFLISELRNAFIRGENIMELGRDILASDKNLTILSEIAYDLQSGSYVSNVLNDAESYSKWHKQIANILNPYVNKHSSLLEIGCGEATTLTGVIKELNRPIANKLGFDISWSRCAIGLDWLKTNSIEANLFVADIFNIPLQDSSIDVVYTCHSLEPNGGREKEAISELLRVARNVVAIIEPIYELASTKAQERMTKYGYVTNLKETLRSISNLEVREYKLLDFSLNKLNPTGLILIEKSGPILSKKSQIQWRCPFSKTNLTQYKDAFYSNEAGLAYPFLKNIPLLHVDHAILASKYNQIQT